MVVYGEASDISHTMASATSSAVPPRCMGTWWARSRTRSGRPPLARYAHCVYPLGGVHHACVVHQRSDAAQLRVHGGKQGQHLGLVGHIGLYGQGGAACGADLLHHRIGGGLVALVVHRYRPALARGQPGGGGANASAGTGD